MTFFFVVSFITAMFGDPTVTVETTSLETCLRMRRLVIRELASQTFTATECVPKVDPIND